MNNTLHYHLSSKARAVGKELFAFLLFMMGITYGVAGFALVLFLVLSIESLLFLGKDTFITWSELILLVVAAPFVLLIICDVALRFIDHSSMDPS